MTGALLFGVLVLVAVAIGPGLLARYKAERRAAQVRSLTRQTIRDMNKATKPEDRLW